jgi:hypothetical protein
MARASDLEFGSLALALDAWRDPWLWLSPMAGASDLEFDWPAPV